MKSFIRLVILYSMTIGCPDIYAQVHDIPCGDAPIIDGDFETNEWKDAASFTIALANSKTVEVLAIHDSSSLYFAFAGNLQSQMRFPEVMVDVNNDKTQEWKSDDWWFHVSATDCEYQGQHSNYDSCQTERPNWTGIPNMNPGLPTPPLVDTVEIGIPYNTLGSVKNGDTIGLAFDVTNTFNAWDYWPATAKLGDPSTWASVVLSCGNSSSHDITGGLEMDIFPNPGNGLFHLHIPSSLTEDQFKVAVFNSSGHQIYQQPGTTTLDLTGLPKGLYWVSAEGAGNVYRQSLVIR